MIYTAEDLRQWFNHLSSCSKHRTYSTLKLTIVDEHGDEVLVPDGACAECQRIEDAVWAAFKPEHMK